MLERRKEARRRVILGGTIAFNGRKSVLDCRIRNLSKSGALLALDSTAMIPDEFDFVMRERAVQAQILWRTTEAAGIRFVAAPASNVVPLDYAIQLKASQRENQRLRRRIADLAGEA